MPRPKKCRNIGCQINSNIFKPAGIPYSELEFIELEVDEYEALRLSDIEKMYQHDAAALMGISRQTYGNLLEKAHGKISEAILQGKGIIISESDREFYNFGKKKCRREKAKYCRKTGGQGS